MLTALGVGIGYACTDPEHRLIWILFSFLSFCILYLTFMVRQHYALGNQDRILRLEFRVRCFELLDERSEEQEKQLSFAQIAALRFADDAEFVELLHRAQKENLSADEIKKSIKHWKADDMRL